MSSNQDLHREPTQCYRNDSTVVIPDYLQIMCYQGTAEASLTLTRTLLRLHSAGERKNKGEKDVFWGHKESVTEISQSILVEANLLSQTVDEDSY